MNLTLAEKFGRSLVVLGTIGFAVASILSFTEYSRLDEGALPASSFAFIIIGMAFAFPSLLQESKGEVSTMRVIVFTVVMVFAIIYIKIGWTAGSFSEFKIDSTWVYILGLAFGSKVFQKFGEENKNQSQ